MPMALKGLKVLDFSTLLPGPFASLYLADMGAEVIHVESPTRPDLVRMMPPYANGQATAHSYLNRNKQSIALDLKDAVNIELVKNKISEFDIVIEQFRPNVMRRLGLDYETLAEINPRLIYCSITLFHTAIERMHNCALARKIMRRQTIFRRKFQNQM